MTMTQAPFWLAGALVLAAIAIALVNHLLRVADHSLDRAGLS